MIASALTADNGPPRPRGPDFFSSWLRLALVRDGLVFLAFLVGLLAVMLYGFHRGFAERNLETVSAIVAGNLGTLSAAVKRLPEDAREPFVRQVAGLSQGALQLGEPAPGSLREPQSIYLETSFRMVREFLPGETVAYSAQPSEALWMTLPGAARQTIWVRVPLFTSGAREQALGLTTAMLLPPMALLGGLALLAQQRRRLAAHAARATASASGAQMPAQAEGWSRLAALYAHAPAAAREPLAQLAQSWQGLMPAQPPADPRPLRKRARSTLDLVREIAVLAGLSLLLLAAAGWAADGLVIRPRFEFVGDGLAVQLRGMRAVAATLPIEQRAAFERDLNRISGGRIEVVDPSPWALQQQPQRRLLAYLVDHVRAGLPGVAVATTPEPSALWVPLPWATRDGGWLRIPNSPGLALFWLVLTVGLAVIAVLGSVLVVLHGRRRAARVARAIEGGEPDLGLQAEVLLLLSSEAELRQRWEASLASQGQQEAARAQRLREARGQLAALRQLRPPGPAGIEALQLLDEMDRALSALEGEAGAPAALDLDALVSELAAVARAPVAVSGGGLPWLPLRRTEVLRLLREVFAEVLARGGEVRTALEQRQVVLRFHGTGPREPALAAARQQAQALGGTLREQRLEDGGLLVELCLPVSRS